MRDRRWLRGVITLAVLGGLVGAMLASPVGAAFNPTKKKVKNIAKKEAKKYFNSNIGPALASEQDACADGAVRGFAYLRDGDLGATFGTSGVAHSFNCTGGSVEARRNGVGDYDVRFNGLTSPTMTTDDAAVANVSVGNDTDRFASYESTSGDDFLELRVWDLDLPGAVDDEVAIVLFNDPV